MAFVETHPQGCEGGDRKKGASAARRLDKGLQIPAATVAAGEEDYKYFHDFPDGGRNCLHRARIAQKEGEDLICQEGRKVTWQRTPNIGERRKKKTERARDKGTVIPEREEPRVAECKKEEKAL